MYRNVYESYKKADGKCVYTDSAGKVQKAHNGVYVAKNGDIYLDLNAGNHSEGLVLNTFAHELYHHVEKHAPDQAKALAEFIAKELGEENVEAAVNRQIEKARKAGYGEGFFEEQGMSAEEARQTVYDRAYSDFIADGLETMFTKGDVVQKLADLHRQDKGLFHTIRKFIRKWVSKLREFYNAGNTLSIEGRQVAELETFDKIQQMFAEALKVAGENYRAAGDIGVEIDGYGVHYSIREDVVDVNGVEYGQVVELEYIVFNRVKRSGKAFVDFIRNNLIKQKITVFDNNGDSEVIEFAGEKERVRKDGAKNSHPVIGELTRAKNEIKKLVIVNAVDTTEISQVAKTSSEHSHQWLDENGWEERTSHVMTKDDTIYPVTLHIAKAKDGRNILYDVNVKINEGVATDKIATSLQAKKQAGQAVRITMPSEITLTQSQQGVKKYSTRDTESVSSRSLLANALDSVAQDETEKRRLAEYREAIGKLEGYEKELAELKV